MKKRCVMMISICCILAAAFFTAYNFIVSDKGNSKLDEKTRKIIFEMNQLGEEYGYKNALSELTEKSMTDVDSISYHRLQQNYKGIPVYGRSVVYVEDENESLLTITGNVMDVDENLSLVPKLTQEQANIVASEYAANELGFEDIDSMKFYFNSDNPLCIYNLSSDKNSHLAYIIGINYISNTIYCYEIIVDAQNGDVLNAQSSLSNETVTGYMVSDIEKNQGFPVEKESEDIYILKDVSRGLSVRNFLGRESETKNENDENIYHFFDGNASIVSSTDNIFGNGIEASLGYETAARLLINVSKIQDIILSELDLNTPPTVNGEIYLYYNDGYSNGKNARGGTVNDGLGVLSMGSVTGVDDIDIIAHEYTHIISSSIVQWSSDNVNTGSIIEGISDIYGEIIEARYFNSVPNWRMFGDNIDVDRDLIDPRSSGHAETVTDQHPAVTDDDYGYSTVISHVAYLMWNGINDDDSKKLSDIQLLKLWYNAMLMMPADCDFQMCRNLVEIAAQNMKLTDNQIQCVGEAFDVVGIYTQEFAYQVSENVNLILLDQNNQPYDNYTVYIAPVQTKPEAYLFLGKKVKLEEVISKSQNTIKVNYSEPCKLKLDQGIYTIAMVDNVNKEKSVIRTFWVGSKGADTFTVQTDFGTVEINFEHVYDNGKEYAVITGTDSSGIVTWKYETEHYDCTDLDRVTEIGMQYNGYYFVENGTVVVLKKSDGSLLWKNQDFGGSATDFVFGEDGTLYLCGYLGPDFFAVSRDGETLCRIESFNPDYYWAVDIKCDSEKAVVCLEGTPGGYSEKTIDFEVDLNTYTYAMVSTNNDINCYIPVIEEAIAETAYDSATGSGFLYDIDSDGIDELVILNVYAEVDGYNFPGYAYSVYDIENGEVIVKCDKEVLFYDAGGPAGYVGVVNYLGSTALVVYVDNGETGYQAHRESLYTIYDPDSLQIIVSASLDYVSTDTLQVNNCTVNGNSCSYNDYLSIIDAFETIMIAEIYSNDGSDGSMGLYELLYFIQETSGIT